MKEKTEQTQVVPTLVYTNNTTWHDGCTAILDSSGNITAVASERIGDRVKHDFDPTPSLAHLEQHLWNSLSYLPNAAKIKQLYEVGPRANDGHHRAHAAGAFFGSGFKDAAVLVVDGQGPQDGLLVSTTLWRGVGDRLDLVEAPYTTNETEKIALQSVGHFYSAIGALTGMQGLHEEGKTMGLAPYGKMTKYYDFLKKYAYSKLDGTYFMDKNFVRGVFGNTLGKIHYEWNRVPPEAQAIFDEFMALRGSPLRSGEEDVSQDDMDVAYAGQLILEEIMLGLTERIATLTGSKNLCLAGGVALNSVANGKIVESGLFHNVFVFPAAGDDGQAMGQLFDEIHKRKLPVNTKMETAYYGPEYSEKQIQDAIVKFGDKVKVISHEKLETIQVVTDLLASEKVVGWFQGRSEIGPRALGHRSILADPRNPGMRDYLNQEVKHREWYRPFAPVVLEERLVEFFELNVASPFMLLVAKVKKPETIPSACHVDGTARVQTIRKDQDAMYYNLVKSFGDKTGIPVLLNTSFNDAGEPMVETPEHALQSFVNMKLDALVINDLLIVKK